MRVPATEEMRKRQYILANEVFGLYGLYHLFGNKELTKVEIAPMERGLTSIVAFGSEVQIRKDDCFGLDPKTQKIWLVKGPSWYPNQFLKVAAQCKFNTETVTFADRVEVNILRNQTALTYNSLAPQEHRCSLYYGNNCPKIFDVDLAVIKNNDSAKRQVVSIAVKNNCCPNTVFWLKEICRIHGWYKEPSGAFDVFRTNVAIKEGLHFQAHA